MWEARVGVRRAGLAYLLPHLQAMPVDNIGEPVAPDRVVLLEIAPVHVPELGASDSRILRTDAPDVFQCEGFPGSPGQDLRLVMLVICLLRYAKQPAKELNPIPFGILRMQVLYRLAPAFFLIGILNLASAIFMSSSYASALISASLSCSRSRFSSS